MYTLGLSVLFFVHDCKFCFDELSKQQYVQKKIVRVIFETDKLSENMKHENDKNRCLLVEIQTLFTSININYSNDPVFLFDKCEEVTTRNFGLTSCAVYQDRFTVLKLPSERKYVQKACRTYPTKQLEMVWLELLFNM